MKCKSKSKAKLLTKHTKKKEASNKARRNKSKRKSTATSEKRQSIVDHLKRKEAIRKSRKFQYHHSISDDSLDESSSYSPERKLTRFKHMAMDSGLNIDSEHKNMTFNKDEFFKNEFKKAQGELIDAKNALYNSQTALNEKEKEVVTNYCIQSL